jgi:hypothetical protein
VTTTGAGADNTMNPMKSVTSTATGLGIRKMEDLRAHQKQSLQKQKQAQKRRSIEEKTLRMISRFRNEERIKRLTERMSKLLLQRTKDLFVEREVLKARKVNPDTDIAKIKHQAQKVADKWTYKNVRATLPSHLVVSKILTGHEICSWREGDMYSTWHISFNNVGYKKEFPLDRDDLPIEPPGAKRADIMKRVFKKADQKTRKGRLGIVSDRDRERTRDSRSEWRYFLLRYDKGDGKLDDNGDSPGYMRQEDMMIKRQKGEKHQKALLKEAMTVPIKKSANMVDAVVDAWNKEEQ